MGKYSNYSVS